MYQSDLCNALNELGWFDPAFIAKYTEGMTVLGVPQGPGHTPPTETQIGMAMWWALSEIANS